MPAMASPHLMIEKNFRRLLTSAEKRLEDKTIEDWKLDQVNGRCHDDLCLSELCSFQFVKTLTDMLNDMRKSMA